jgi:hypothetical protein
MECVRWGISWVLYAGCKEYGHSDLQGGGWRQYVPPNINIHLQDSMVLNPEDYSLKNRHYENSKLTDFPSFSFNVIAADKSDYTSWSSAGQDTLSTVNES